MNFFDKYQKYKHKYTEIKKQTAGYLRVFDSGDRDLKIAGYIFTRRSSDGKFLFGCVRKVYRGGKSYGTMGAAGTEPKFWGKWTSVGGTRSRSSKHHLDAIIIELNDETNSSFTVEQVDLTKLNSSLRKPLDIRLTCHLAEKISGAAVFIFEMEENQFLRIFPVVGREAPDIFRTSHGEIDAIRALTMDEIINLQEDEIKTNGNNYFISYFLKNLVRACISKINELNPAFRAKWSNINPTIVADTKERMPTEFLHKAY
jgi:hypothetical protein